MEKFVFIHGSSVGQSIFLPDGVPSAICEDIASKFFQGRVLRIKESEAKRLMFVELYRSAEELFTVYSFVNNVCLGSNGRDGQYFAISILCKNAYCNPEPLYRMMTSAYSQMLQTQNILQSSSNADKYVIAQFSERKDYLNAFISKINQILDKNILADVHPLNNVSVVADYENWTGVNVSVEMCNAHSTYKKLLEKGRVCISDEYETPQAKIDSLSEQVKVYQEKVAKLEQQIAETARADKYKAREEIENLNARIRRREREIQELETKNEEYVASMNRVLAELNKVHSGNRDFLASSRSSRELAKSNTPKELLKIGLLVLILIFSLLGSILNYSFFRTLSCHSEGNPKYENKEMSGKTGDKAGSNSNPIYDNLTKDADDENAVEPDKKEGLRTGDTKHVCSYKIIQSLNGKTISTQTGEFEVTKLTDVRLGKITKGTAIEITLEQALSGCRWHYSNCASGPANPKSTTVRTNVSKIGESVVVSYRDGGNKIGVKFHFELASGTSLGSTFDSGARQTNYQTDSDTKAAQAKTKGKTTNAKDEPNKTVADVPKAAAEEPKVAAEEPKTPVDEPKVAAEEPKTPVVETKTSGEESAKSDNE